VHVARNLFNERISNNLFSGPPRLKLEINYTLAPLVSRVVVSVFLATLMLNMWCIKESEAVAQTGHAQADVNCKLVADNYCHGI
jgi:hypothetical protein